MTAIELWKLEQILSATPERAGFMVAWEHIRRWQNVGHRNESKIGYIQYTVDSSPVTLLHGMHGGGYVEHSLNVLAPRVPVRVRVKSGRWLSP